MATNRQGRHYNRNAYVYGNAARNIDVRTAIEERPTGAPLREIKGNQIRTKKMHMSFMYVLFLVGAMMVTGYALVSYLRLQSDIANLNENVSFYETRLNNLTLANDDEYSKMIEAVDLETIRTVAITELGMVYPNEDQIVSYVRENSDYVRQINDLTN